MYGRSILFRVREKSEVEVMVGVNASIEVEKVELGGSGGDYGWAWHNDVYSMRVNFELFLLA